jgi:hypothetical protein
MGRKSKEFGDDDDTFGFSSSYNTGGVGKYIRCADSHPTLTFEVPEGGTFTPGMYSIHGGNGDHPNIKDGDVYIALHGGSSGKGTTPWDEGKYKPVQDLQFYITDGQPPKNEDDFMRMIIWVCNQLQSGKKIHFGCIGGHGRTGTALAAVVALMTGMEDPITYVRQHYCKKAVESSSQVKFLMKHFNCKEVVGSKTHSASATSVPKGSPGWGWGGSMPKSTASGDSAPKSSGTMFAGAKRVFDPVPSDRCIFDQKP